MRDRRSEVRFGADQSAVVSVPDTPIQDLPAQIVEASKSGLRIITAFPIETGALIEVKWDFTVLRGEARYCRQTGRETYCTGLKIAEVLGHGKLRTQPGAA